jgi:cytochrome c553
LIQLNQTFAAMLFSVAVCSTWAQADEARAKKIVAGSCFLCHGEGGESSSEVFPKLAGQHAEYIAKQLENFKSGKRKSTAMADMSSRLKPDEMLAVGKYFESKSAPPEPAKDQDLAGVGRLFFTMETSIPGCLPVPVAMARMGWEPHPCPGWRGSMRHMLKRSSSCSTNGSEPMTMQ